MQLKKSLNSHHTIKNQQPPTLSPQKKKKIKTNRKKEYDDKRTEIQMIEDGITRFSLVQKTLMGEKKPSKHTTPKSPQTLQFLGFHPSHWLLSSFPL